MATNKGSEGFTAPPSYYFSPAFQCYAAPTFYKVMLKELESIAIYADRCRPAIRQVVWKRLFILLGCSPDTLCTNSFGPILREWTRPQYYLNLLAVEALYLAFAICLEQNPNLLVEGYQASNPNVNLTSLPRPGGDKRSYVVLPSPPVPKPAGAQQPNYQELSAMKRSQNQKQYAPRASASSKTNPPAPAPAPVASPAPSAASSAPLTADITMKLVDLQTWKNALANQPGGTRERIWKLWSGLSDTFAAPDPYISLPIHKVINSWSKDLHNNCNNISNLHAAVKMLIERGDVDLSLTGPPPAEPAPPQPDPRAPSPSHSRPPPTSGQSPSPYQGSLPKSTPSPAARGYTSPQMQYVQHQEQMRQEAARQVFGERQRSYHAESESQSPSRSGYPPNRTLPDPPSASSKSLPSFGQLGFGALGTISKPLGPLTPDQRIGQKRAMNSSYDQQTKRSRNSP